MNRFTEIAIGKCERCGDQLLSIPGRNREDSRRIVCPICVTNNLEDSLERLRWRPTEDEQARMAQ